MNTSSTPTATAAVPAVCLSRLGIIRVSGQDARTYLQGQLTADLDALSPEHVQLACVNSPQGRVQAVLWMIARTDGIALLLPTTMLDATVARLRKYVLRAKAKIDTATGLQIGLLERSALPGDVLLPEPQSHRELRGVSYLSLPGHDHVMVVASELAATTDVDLEHRWHTTQIRAGLPQVYPETHESFVAQMLNVDLLGGINFTKGCYTGQEIIARAHYRGAVKRRMFRFKADSAPPSPGTRVLTGEQHAGDVVDAVATEDGCELLAVISLAQIGNPLRIDTQPTATLTRMELPYVVPA